MINRKKPNASLCSLERVVRPAPTERTARGTDVDPGGGMTGDAAGEATDRSGRATDRSGTTVDWSGTAADRSGTAVDWSGTMVDRSGRAADRSGTTADRSTATVDWSGMTADWSGERADWSGMTRHSGPNGLKLSDRGWRRRRQHGEELTARLCSLERVVRRPASSKTRGHSGRAGNGCRSLARRRPRKHENKTSRSWERGPGAADRSGTTADRSTATVDWTQAQRRRLAKSSSANRETPTASLRSLERVVRRGGVRDDARRHGQSRAAGRCQRTATTGSRRQATPRYALNGPAPTRKANEAARQQQRWATRPRTTERGFGRSCGCDGGL